MLCNKCNKKEATYYMEQNINGKVIKLALCPDCAKEYTTYGLGSFGGLNLLGSLFNSMAKPQREREQKRCTLCASSYDDIAASGRVGCAECYNVFANELDPSIRRIHGNLKHVGRSPLGNSRTDIGAAEAKESNDPAVDELAQMRRELKDAVEREDYEKAAELRDRIRALSEE